MGILSANNNVSFNANNTCRIYIIKQIYYEQQEDFEKQYANLLSSDNSILNKVGKWVDNINVLDNNKVKLTPLMFGDVSLSNNINFNNPYNYTKIIIDSNDETKIYDKNSNSFININEIQFLTDLLELRNCPLIDFTKRAYIFQIDGQVKSGIGDVISFNANFSVNGQSSCDISLANQDYKYNFKYFNDKDKYTEHLKCYFDTNDIIIVRMQKKNTTATSLLNSFKSSICDYQDIYKSEKNDPMTTVFTGYINNINESFSYENGSQTLNIQCAGPSKKLTWTRVLQNQAMASKDSGAAILPLSVYVTGALTSDKDGKNTLKNKDVVKNLITRVYSGLTNTPKMREIRKNFDYYFDKSNNGSKEEKEELEKLLTNEKTERTSNSALNLKIADLRKQFRDEINKNFNDYVEESKDEIKIYLNSFITEQDGWKQTPLFIVKGTDQPAYQYQFERFNEMFQANFSTAYQFIKGIADNLLFNFYDDPYGIIHFSVPDITLKHLYRNDKNSEVGTDPNVLTQILSFSQTQNTESIANIQSTTAQTIYQDVTLQWITNCVKDYDSIAKYGEKLMQPFVITGITDREALKYASKMRMIKYNRKALADIKMQIQGEPGLKMDKYAYIKDLRKLFYVESYSHSYQAGGNFTTSLNGTYLRNILASADFSINDTSKVPVITGVGANGSFTTSKTENLSISLSNLSLNNYDKKLSLANSFSELQAGRMDFALNIKSLQALIYNMYVTNHNYPANSVELQREIEGLYPDKNVIENCYLDGFFWEIPFDVNPYKMALQIEKEEKEKLSAQNANIRKKNYSSNKIKINNNLVKSALNKVRNTEALKKSAVFNYTLDTPTITKLEWQAGDFLPHFKKYKPYYIKVDINDKGIDWMGLLETAAKNTGPQLKGK